MLRFCFKAHGLYWIYSPQVLPVLHEGEELKLGENELPPVIFEAKEDIFLDTCLLSQAGQLTSLVSALRSRSSNSQPQFSQENSKIGIGPP
jgi:hypothetical protein